MGFAKTRLKHVAEFKYFGCVMDESGTAKAEYSRKMKQIEGK